MNLQKEDDIINTDDGLVFSPFNPNNIEITRKDVQKILNTYGITSNLYNINLYKRAFVHKSYTKRPDIENSENNITIVEKPDDCLPLKTKSNERLEFIGDGVLELITKYYLYRRFPKADEGFMTEKKIALVKNEHIGKIAYEMGLNKWMLMSKHAEEKKTRTNPKKLGCLFEAFIGALFLDFNKIQISDEHNWFKDIFVVGPGFQMAQIFVENILEKHVDWQKLIKTDDNYKNILQVIIQKKFKTTPNYIILNHDEDEGYEMGVFLCYNKQIYDCVPSEATSFSTYKTCENILNEIESGKPIFVLLGKGKHKVKKKAEQLASSSAIKNIT